MNHSFLDSGAIIATGNNTIAVGSGTRTWLNSPSNSESNSFYFPDFFFNDHKPWFSHQQNNEFSFENLSEFIGTKNSLVKPNILWENTQKPIFESAFSDLKKRFASNELSKAVPYIFETTSQRMTPSILAWILHNLINYAKNNLVHLYGFWDHSHGMIGATPEKLFSLHPTKIETMACAGTARDQMQLNLLMNNPKERQEHSLVVKGIQEALVHFGKTIQKPLRVLTLPHLSHLVTDIETILEKPADFDFVVRALHPTPALGAYPIKFGEQWLRMYQTQIDRKRFGAPVGCIRQHQESSHCFVAIRNIQWDSNGIYMGAGCGVVPASNVENEWAEIEAKIKAIKKMMDL